MPARVAPAPNALEAVIADEIRAHGPIPLARYMELAQAHPTLGYYRRQDPFGVHGDFISAPEISQMFGEVIGLWLAQGWLELGRPRPVRLVELGPGRGTMMADMLRAMQGVPELRADLEIHLVETSEALRATQRTRLGDEPVTWHEHPGTIPPGAMLLVANEFFDALPIRQLERTPRGWQERRVGIGAEGEFTFVLAEEVESLSDHADAPPGTITEVSPARASIAEAIGHRLAGDPGVALVIDYGAFAEGPTGETLQAVRAKRRAEPLDAPGEADLSSHVDFRALAMAARHGGAAVYGPVPQGTFLRGLGVEARALALMERARPEQRRELRRAVFRLADPSAMGELFKVMALAGPDAPPPPGFSAPTAVR